MDTHESAEGPQAHRPKNHSKPSPAPNGCKTKMPKIDNNTTVNECMCLTQATRWQLRCGTSLLCVGPFLIFWAPMQSEIYENDSVLLQRHIFQLLLLLFRYPSCRCYFSNSAEDFRQWPNEQRCQSTQC
uniref:Uncharacterized protein n=1 Tax=Trypanosoma vivax (strain Y486) TaxID=1055687 RepID=G0U360_TRYVY|nr:hypothetical protein, unlikely [Trypanosoma vivax Y486]